MEILAKLKYSLCLTLTVLMLLVSAQAQSEARITFYHHDNLGSPIAASDRDGNVLWRETYAPFGQKTVNDSAAEEERVGYTGKLHDNDTGLTYLNARYYDPVVGRFMAMDPVGPLEGGLDHFNRYSYVYNNPLKYIDPTGEIGLCGCGNAGAGGAGNHTGLDPESSPEVQEAQDRSWNEMKRIYQERNESLGWGLPDSFFDSGDWRNYTADLQGLLASSVIGAKNKRAQKTYVTYTKYNPKTGKTYSGMASGYGTPEQVLKRRDRFHHMNLAGYGPAKLDKVSSNRDAIRGREQGLIDYHGGAQSEGGTSGNKIRGISKINPKLERYMRAAAKAFGSLGR